MDIGSNTGRWSLKCLNYDPDVHVTLVDHPGQIKLARDKINDHGLTERVHFCPMDVLEENNQFPRGYAATCMSQFLYRFSLENITAILRKAFKSLSPKDHR